MTQTASDVVVAQNGSIYWGAENLAAPQFKATPGAGWTELGLATEDGVTITHGVETTDVTAWQVSGVVRRLVTNEPKSLAFTLIQFDPAAVRIALRGGTFAAGGTASGGGTPAQYRPASVAANPVLAMYITAQDGTANFAYWFPRCQISGETATALQRGAAQVLPITMEVLAASSGTADRFNIYSDHTAWVAAIGT